VFPNGFFEVVLSGGKELVISGDAAETKALTVTINGAARECRLDADGICQIQLAAEAGKELTVRISKSGPCYPLIYAVAVR
jgi:hypothetical protein